jgi:CO/xanthine dehydrogenase FAD-binding subunit
MRSRSAEFDLRQPKNLAEALRWLSEEKGLWRPIAGGTDLMVLFDAGKLPAGKFMALWGLKELEGISETPEGLRLGSLVTFSMIRRSPLIKARFPLLSEAAASVGAVAIQNRATLGGNIMNASPAADSVPALVAHDALLELVSSGGKRRRVPVAAFFKGYKQMDVAPEELLQAIILPWPRLEPERRAVRAFRKVGSRRAQTISKVVFAARASLVEGRLVSCRMAAGSVGPTVVSLHKACEILEGQTLTPGVIDRAVEAAREAVSPIDDLRSSAMYRHHVLGEVVREALENWAKEGV